MLGLAVLVASVSAKPQGYDYEPPAVQMDYLPPVEDEAISEDYLPPLDNELPSEDYLPPSNEYLPP